MTVRRSLLTILAIALVVIPLMTHAGMSLEGNKKCEDYGYKDAKCSCGKCCKERCTTEELGIKDCDCTVSPPTGTVTGKCVTSDICAGKSYTDQQGQSQSPGDAKGMMDALKGIMDMLKGKDGGGGGGGQPPQQGQGLDDKGCTSYYQVTAPSTDPCVYYVPPTSDSLLNTSGLGISGSDELLDALNAGEDSALLNVSDTLLGTLGGLPGATETGTETGITPTSTTSLPAVGGNLFGRQVNLQSGTWGDIVVTDGGATIVAQARDAGANTEVAGFYGSDAYGGQPQGVIAGMCQNRPWAGSIVSFIIPPVFFDGLCAWRGYQVGLPAPPSQPFVERPTKAATTTASPAASPQPQASTVPPRVEIWAVPDRIPLGTRTSVFWNTRGVESCSITSPEGSFNENSLSGGAATVPLTGATTFTISCLTAAGTPVTDFVTVNLSI